MESPQTNTQPEEVFINPLDGIITSSCGSRIYPVLNKTELHDGIDIGVPENTDVVAVKSGKVIEVRTSKTLGNLLKFETEDGYVVTYAHLNKALMEVGDEVEQGQVVAKSGNTGLSTGPHLHYGIQKDGMLLDPMQYVDLSYTDDVVKEYAMRGESVR